MEMREVVYIEEMCGYVERAGARLYVKPCVRVGVLDGAPIVRLTGTGMHLYVDAGGVGPVSRCTAILAYATT